MSLSYSDIKKQAKKERDSTSTSVGVRPTFEEVKKAKFSYDPSTINQWFEDTAKTVNRIQGSFNEPSYDDFKNIYERNEDTGAYKQSKSQLERSSIIDLQNRSSYIKKYIDSLADSEEKTLLSEQYKTYTDALENVLTDSQNISEYVSQFSNETEYNNAVNQAKYNEKYKDYDYSMLRAELDKTDKESDDGLYSYLKDKSHEFATSDDIQKEIDALDKEFGELTPFVEKDDIRRREIEDEWETLEALKEKKKIEEKETEYNNAMFDKYGKLTYEQLVNQYIQLENKDGEIEDVSKKKEYDWLKSYAYNIGTSEQLQKTYDDNQKQMDKIHTEKRKVIDAKEASSWLSEQQAYASKEVEFDDKWDKLYAKNYELKNLIKNKKHDEKVSEFNSLDEDVRNVIYAKNNLNYWSPMTWFDENTEKVEEDFKNLDIPEDKKQEYLETHRRIVEHENAKQHLEAIKEQAENNPPLASAVSVVNNTFGTIPDALKYIGAGIDESFGGDGYVDVTTTNAYKAKTAREEVSKDMNGVGKFLYNTGMSIVDNIARLPVTALPGGKALNLAIAGTSAGVSSANDVIERGGSLTDALFTGGVSAVTEAVFENIPLEKLAKLKNEGTDSVIKAIKTQIGTEAFEELGTDGVNIVADYIINQDLSQVALQYENYIKQGYSEAEAKQKVAVEIALQLGESALGGAISGGVMGSGASALGYISHKNDTRTAGKSIKSKENVSDLIKTAKTLSTDSKAYKLATKLEEQQNSGKKVSSSKVGELRSLVIEQSKSDYNTAYNEATKNLHSEEKAIIDKIARGESLTPEEMKVVNDNSALSKSVEKITSAKKKQFISSTKAEFAPFTSIDDNAVDKSKLNISPKGVTEINDKEYTGAMEVVRTDPDTGVVTYKIEEDGKKVEVTSEEIGFGSYEDAYLDSVASKHNAQTAQKLIDLYEEGQVVEDYATEFNLYQNYGRLAIPLTDDKMSKGHVLNNDQKLGAYEVGVDSRKSYYQTQTIIANNAKKSKYYAYKEGTFDGSAIKDIELSDTQKAFYDFLREFALRTGIKIELFASEVVNGEYIGEQGSFDKNTGTIHIDINAGLKNVSKNDVKHGMLNTFSHELTHVAERGGFYEELHDAIMKAFEKQGNAFDELVDDKKKKILKNHPNADNMSEEELAHLADTEVIADACETMLKNSKIFEDIAQGNPSLAQKIKNALRNFINRLKEMLGSMEALTTEGAILEKCIDDLEQIQKLWDKAVTSGIKTLNATKAEQKNNTDTEDGVKYSERYYNAEINTSILKLIEKVETGDFKANEKVYFDDVPTDAAKEIYAITGIDVQGYKVAIEARQLDHILKDHGKNGKANKSMSNNDDIAKMEYVIKNYDDLSKSGKTQAYTYMKNGRNRTADTILYEKRIGDKSYYVVQAVPETKAKTLYIVTAFIGKSGYNKKETSQLINAKSPDATSIDGSVVVSTNIISSSNKKVNDNEDIRYQYAGRKSKTANLSKLQKAEELEQNGVDSETIRKETGWFRSYDKKWRYEIDDSKMKLLVNSQDVLSEAKIYREMQSRFNELQDKVIHDKATEAEEQEYYNLDEAIVQFEHSDARKLSNYISHPELFKSYPQLKDVRVFFDENLEYRALYNLNTNTITINPSIYVNEGSFRSTVLHEIQHAIQKIEFFSNGSNEKTWERYINNENFEKKPYNQSAEELNHNTAGEIEARDTANRRDLNQLERKNTRPDIDNPNVVFRDDMLKYQSRGVSNKDFRKYDNLTKLDTKQIEVYNNYGWTYQLFTAEDYLLLNEKFNEKYNLNKNQNDFVLGDGSRVVEVNNKLVLIGGSFENPIIYDVFVVNSNNETEAEIYKELLLNDAEENRSTKQRYIDICKSYEYYSEKETVRNYESTDFSYHKGQKDSGERAVLPESFQNYGYTKQFKDRGRYNSEAEKGVSNNQVDKVFQMRTDGTYSNRTLLANALESSVQNEVERNLIKAYKEGIAQLDEMEAKLKDVKNQIKEISFTKDSDRSQLLKLNNQKKMLTNKIARKDKQLFKLESMESMQKLIALEKDKAIKRTKKKMDDRVAKIRQQEREQAKKLVAETREKYQKTLREVREGSDKKLIAEREKRKSQIKKFRNNRERTEYVEKIRKLQKKFTQMLLNPTDKSFVIPDCLKGGFPEACKLITDAVILDNTTQAGEALEKVSRTIVKLIKENDTEASLFKDEFSSDFKELVDTLSNSLKDKKIGKNLTLEEAEDIYSILNQIYDVVRTANKMLSREDAITISESSEKMIDELGNVKGNKGILSKGFMQILNPIRVAQVHSGYNESSELMNHMNELDKGEIKASEWDMNARKPFEALEKSNSKAYDKAITEVEMIEYIANNGDTKTVKMTRMQGMQILLSWEREAHNPKLIHMQTGGIVLPDAELMAKGKLEEAYDKKQTINGINYFFVKAIADTMTDFDWLYMGLAKKYFNEVSKKAINEVSLKLKHREVATENYYIPFSVDNRYLATEYESVKFDTTLENAGKLKSLVVRDSKPIVIAGLNNVLNRDISDTARLYGLAVPLRDFKKAFKLTSRENITFIDGTPKNVSGESARGIINDKWGETGSEFYDKLVSDLTTERKSEKAPFVKPLNKLRSAKITSVFTANLGITIKQLSAYPSALLYLSHKSLAHGAKQSGYIWTNWDTICDEIDTYTPLHYKRRKGLSSREMTEFSNTKLSKKMKDMPSMLNPTKWIQCMDCYITAMHWEACKAEVASKFEVGTTEYWNEVTNLYNKVINDTQQNYDIMHTAEVTKSKNGLWENLFMFRTEPLQHTGVLYEAVMEYSNTKSKKSKTKLVKAIASQIESAVVYAGLGAFVALILYKLNPYKDEDDEITPQSVLTKIGTDVFENIAGLIAPIAGEAIAEIISATITGKSVYDTELMVIQTINDLKDVFYDVQSIIKSVAYKLSLGLEVDFMAVSSELWESTKTVLEAFGVPLQNVENIFTAIPKWTGIITDSPEKASTIAKQYGNAYSSGDKEKSYDKLENLYQQKLEEYQIKKETNPEDFKNTTPEKKARNSVRDTLCNAYKKEYQEAFLRNDTKRMQEIVSLLQSSGYMKWENQLLSEKLSDWRKSAKEDLSK